jgi:hypothetical protein
VDGGERASLLYKLSGETLLAFLQSLYEIFRAIK